MKKIRFTMPHIIKEKIEEDKKHFGFHLGEIGNRLLSYYSNKEIENLGIKSNNGEIVQFNLNQRNDDLYETIIKEHSVDNEAEFFRDLFFQYLNNPRYIREQILYSDIFKEINSALEEKKKINIKYNGAIRTINPYFIKVSSIEDRSYIFCYCEVNKEYRNYRLANIKDISISRYDIEFKDPEYIKQVEKNFDPFLSTGKQITIKINEQGKLLFEKVILNRPKVLRKDNDIWTLECTNRLAKIYFPQFLSSVEILEPTELREWFKDELQNLLNKYL